MALKKQWKWVVVIGIALPCAVIGFRYLFFVKRELLKKAIHWDKIRHKLDRIKECMANKRDEFM